MAAKVQVSKAGGRRLGPMSSTASSTQAKGARVALLKMATMPMAAAMGAGRPKIGPMA